MYILACPGQRLMSSMTIALLEIHHLLSKHLVGNAALDFTLSKQVIISS